MAFNDGIKAGPIAYIGLVSVLVTFALVLLLQVLYYQQSNQSREADLAAEGPPRELTELTAKQRTALTRRGYVDRQRGIVAIGIERAKELVVTDLAAGKSPSEVIGPRRPVVPPAEEMPVKKPTESGEGQPAADAAATDTTAETTAETDEQPKEKQEPKDDKKS